MEKRMQDRQFIQGVGWAVATTYRQHDNGVACVDLVQAAGYTLSEFKAAGVDDYDMQALEKLFNTGAKHGT
jgi:hypothetical protein